MSILKQIMNEQLNKSLKEIEALEHSVERTKLRIMLVNALANASSCDITAKEGKEAIKETTAKTPTLVEPEEEIETVEAEIVSEGEEDQSIDTDEAVDMEETAPIEEGETEEVTEPVITQNEEGQDVDITDAYLWVQYAEDEEARISLALRITEYMCLPAYAELSDLVVTNAEGGEELLCDTDSKFLLSYYLTPYEDSATGVDFVNEKVKEFSDGQYEDYKVFINNENIDAFVEYLAN